MPPEPESSACTVAGEHSYDEDARMNTIMELEIGPGPDPGSYVVHVLQSAGGGEVTETITIDLDELVDRRPLLEATVLSSSVSARRVMSATEAVVQDVGRRLFDATFSGDVAPAPGARAAGRTRRTRGRVRHPGQPRGRGVHRGGELHGELPRDDAVALP